MSIDHYCKWWKAEPSPGNNDKVVILCCFSQHFQAWTFSKVVSVFESCEHFHQLWAFLRVVFSRVVSIFQSCEHFQGLWTFSRVVSIFTNCEHFHRLWAFSLVVSIFKCESCIFEPCEHFQVLWAFSNISENLWALPSSVFKPLPYLQVQPVPPPLLMPLAT